MTAAPLDLRLPGRQYLDVPHLLRAPGPTGGRDLMLWEGLRPDVEPVPLPGSWKDFR